MKLKYHFSFSLVLALILYIYTKLFILSVFFLLSGILIDLDHLIDYFLEFGFEYNLKKISNTFKYKGLKKKYYILHSWELILFMIFLIPFINFNEYYLGITLGFTTHISLDQLYKNPCKWNYFYFWRYNKNFIYNKNQQK